MKIKISINAEYPSADLEQFLGTDAGSDEFIFNSPTDSADAWFVIEGTLPEDNKCVVPENRVFFLGAETARSLGFFYETPGWLGYLDQFAEIYSPQELYRENAKLAIPFLPWMINSNHGPNMFSKSPRDLEFLRSLSSLEKTREISVFCSSQSMTEEHRTRLRFVAALKDHFGSRLDWFGNGVNPLEQKWDGLAPYTYTIVLENQSSSHVLTEKIQDAFLALAVPIYWGASQARQLFGEDSFFPIDIKDIHASIALIEQILDSDPYESLIPSILAAKAVVTEDLNLFFRMKEIMNNPLMQNPCPPKLKTIRPVECFIPRPHPVDNVIRHLYSFFYPIVQGLRRL